MWKGETPERTALEAYKWDTAWTAMSPIPLYENQIFFIFPHLPFEAKTVSMTHMFPVQLYHKLMTLESFTLPQITQILLGVTIGFFSVVNNVKHLQTWRRKEPVQLKQWDYPGLHMDRLKGKNPLTNARALRHSLPQRTLTWHQDWQNPYNDFSNRIPNPLTSCGIDLHNQGNPIVVSDHLQNQMWTCWP